MPRPERSVNQPPQGGSPLPVSPSLPIQGAPVSQGGIREDIRALNSSILLVTQKIKYLVRNEKILGRNLVVLNKKIKTLEERVNNSPQHSESSSVSGEEVSALQQKISLLEAQLEELRSRTALKEEFKELKYVIDSINPLEFATLSQVRELIEKKLEEDKKKP
jgi:predicted RNase H-like nuclease (RuvC/YqgF family)